MAAGFCVAGIREGSSQWVRPVKQSGQISKHDLVDASGQPVAPLDLISIDLRRRRPNPPHSEDWIADFTGGIVIEERPSEAERQSILQRLTEASPDKVLKDKASSLVLIEPDEISFISFDPSHFGRYDVRLGFTFRGAAYQGESKAPGFKCTDLKLRNWGRRFRSRRVLNDQELRAALGVEKIFLVMGLARWFEGNYWPMVVGLHTCPDFLGKADFDKP